MNTNFQFNTEKCSACHACMIACMDQNDTDIEKGGTPLRVVTTKEGELDGHPRIFGISKACLHCEKPACALACPMGCITRDSETGMVLQDSENCIACLSCKDACPHNAIFVDAEGSPQKCDGCFERIRNGMEAACARVCPTGALILV